MMKRNPGSRGTERRDKKFDTANPNAGIPGNTTRPRNRGVEPPVKPAESSSADPFGLDEFRPRWWRAEPVDL